MWPTLSTGLALLCHFEGKNPRGNFDDLYSETYEVDWGSSSPHPTEGAAAFPCRGLLILPLGLTDYGCSPIGGTSRTWLAYVDSSWWSIWLTLTYFPADHPEGSPTKGLSHMTYNSAFFSCSLPRDRQLTRSVAEPRGQFAPMLPDLADRCVSPPARGYLHPCRPQVAPKLSL